MATKKAAAKATKKAPAKKVAPVKAAAKKVAPPSEPAKLRMVPLEYINKIPGHNPRRTRSAEADAELAESIRAVGILAPLLLRPLADPLGTDKEPQYELVAGERRLDAARVAELAEVPALVRELSDDDVLEVAIHENLEREDVHPLEEADALQRLSVARHYTAQQLSERLGRPRAWVRQRLALAGLCERGRVLYLDGKLTLATALLVARLPIEHQIEAAEKISKVRHDGEPASALYARNFIEHNVLRVLGLATWALDDAKLVAHAGACSECPHTTMAQPDLWEADTDASCTKGSCWEEKQGAAWGRRKKAAAKAGLAVIEGAACESSGVHTYGVYGGEYRDAADLSRVGAEPVSYRELLGPDAVVAVARHPETGKTYDLVRREDAERAERKMREAAARREDGPDVGARGPSDEELREAANRRAYGRVIDEAGERLAGLLFDSHAAMQELYAGLIEYWGSWQAAGAPEAAWRYGDEAKEARAAWLGALGGADLEQRIFAELVRWIGRDREDDGYSPGFAALVRDAGEDLDALHAAAVEAELEPPADGPRCEDVAQLCDTCAHREKYDGVAECAAGGTVDSGEECVDWTSGGEVA